jgi:hypothetical protein
MKGYQRRLGAVYLGTVLLGTLAQGLVPPSVFSDKGNVLNQVFVKAGWVICLGEDAWAASY